MSFDTSYAVLHSSSSSGKCTCDFIHTVLKVIKILSIKIDFKSRIKKIDFLNVIIKCMHLNIYVANGTACYYNCNPNTECGNVKEGFQAFVSCTGF